MTATTTSARFQVLQFNRDTETPVENCETLGVAAKGLERRFAWPSFSGAVLDAVSGERYSFNDLAELGLIGNA